jgi:acyl-CoA thioesterase II
MDARTFLGLESDGTPTGFRLPVVPGITAGGGFLFGGCGLGAAIVALEEVTGRPVVWATAQYLSYARPGRVVEYEVTIGAAGHSITQARAVGRSEGTEILTVNAALGHRDFEGAGEWATMPVVPGPDECKIRTHRFEHESVASRMEQRLAVGRPIEDLDGTQSDGSCALWARMPEVLEMSGAALAVLGDFVPFGIGQSLGLPASGNSLDNTLRVARLEPTDWVLLDIRVLAVANGFGHGAVLIWSQTGTLLAIASQSTIVRFWKDHRP